MPRSESPDPQPLTASQEAELRRLEREATPGKRAVDVDAPPPDPEPKRSKP
jgi:hypothetical protein